LETAEKPTSIAHLWGLLFAPILKRKGHDVPSHSDDLRKFAPDLAPVIQMTDGEKGPGNHVVLQQQSRIAELEKQHEGRIPRWQNVVWKLHPDETSMNVTNQQSEQ
jgi:hypothetical protein